MDDRRERDLFKARKVKPPQKTSKRKQVKGSKDEEKPKRLKFDDDGAMIEVAEDGTVRSVGKVSHSPIDAQRLSYQSLMPGFLTLGCISEITKYDLSVSLPFMLFGRVPITRICQAYTTLLSEVAKSDDVDEEVCNLDSLFKKGQYVVTKVDSVEIDGSSPKVRLCLFPGEINNGIDGRKLREGIVLHCAVASVEDHGYIMETGIPCVKAAFLNRAKAEGAGIVGVGSMVRCVVKQVLKGQDIGEVRLKLSAIPSEVDKSTFDASDTYDYSLLLPGSTVKTTITQVGKTSLKVMLAESDGIIGPYHLNTPLKTLEEYGINQQVKAQILYVTPISKEVHMSLQDKLFSRQSSDTPQQVCIGDFKEGHVYDVERKGVFFMFDKYRAYCSRKNLRDQQSNMDDDDIHFYIGAEHSFRVISYYDFDDTFGVSLRESVMKEQVLVYKELKIGQVLKGTIIRYGDHGAVVNVSKNIEGVVPFLHLTDANVRHPEKKYAIGRSVDVRVLEVEPRKRHLVLTCKTSMVQAEEDIISEYDKKFENTITSGFIVQINEEYLVVGFYDNVTGIVRRPNVSTDRVYNLHQMFTIGNVVKCRVLSVDPEQKKMKLSFILYKEAENDENNMEETVVSGNSEAVSSGNNSNALLSGNDSEVESSRNNIKAITQESDKSKGSEKKERVVLNIGSVIDRCVVKMVKKDRIVVKIKPNDDIGEIPDFLLSDEQDKCKLLKKVLLPGDEIHNSVVFKASKDLSKYFLSTKDSVCHWIQKSKSSGHEKLHESSLYMGVVSEVLPSGMKVSVPVGHYGHGILIPYLRDSNMESHMVGDSIFVKCESHDDKSEPQLSIHSKENLEKRRELICLYSAVQYQKVQQASVVRKGLASLEFRSILIGSKLEMNVVAVTSVGLLLKTANTFIYGVVMNEHLQPETKYEVGTKVTVCVLHVFAKEQCLVLTARSDLVDELHLPKSSHVKINQKIDCEVLLVLEEYSLVRLKSSCVGFIAYIPLDKSMKVGQNIVITVEYLEDGLILGVTKQQKDLKPLPVLPKVPEFAFCRWDLQIKKEFLERTITEEEAANIMESIVSHNIADKSQNDNNLKKEAAGKNKDKKKKKGDVEEAAGKNKNKKKKKGDVEEAAGKNKNKKKKKGDVQEADSKNGGGKKNDVKASDDKIKEEAVGENIIEEKVTENKKKKEGSKKKKKNSKKDLIENKSNKMAKKADDENMIEGEEAENKDEEKVLKKKKKKSAKKADEQKKRLSEQTQEKTDDTEPENINKEKVSKKKNKKKNAKIADNEETGEKPKKLREKEADGKKNRSAEKRSDNQIAKDVNEENLIEGEEAENKHVEKVSKKKKKKKAKEDGEKQIESRKKESDDKKNNSDAEESSGEKKRLSEEIQEAVDKKSVKKRKKSQEKKGGSRKTKDLDQKEENDSGVDEAMDIDEVVKVAKPSEKGKPCLKLSTGFVWNVPEMEDKGGEESSSDEEEDEGKKKKSKKLTRVERSLLAKEEEKRLYTLEKARLEKDRVPQSALDYEELLQESPNSSAVWIQFIAFHLEQAEIDQARSIAKRALQMINVEEFEERINVWTVMLRLEVLYGTQESVEAAFSEALVTNDPLKVYMAMAMVYAESNRMKEAEDIYFKMSKKFSRTVDVWIKAAIFFYKINKLEEARKYMDRGLLSLDKTHHVNLINRFAQLEFQFGEGERARTMFESLLSNYPKRMDMWIVYVDLLTKRGDVEGARQVLERMTSLKLRLRQMRSVFKKFLEFEKVHGTAQSVESVKSRVQDYVAASLQEDQ